MNRQILRANKQGRICTNRKGNKRPIVALVERGGNVRTFHVPVADKVSVTKIVREHRPRNAAAH